MAELQVRDLTSDDHDRALDVRTRSFGPLSSGGTTWWREHFERHVTSRRALGVIVDGDLVATTRIHAYRQLWGGQALPMAGIAGVVVAPEWRGRGVARKLMTATMQRAVELGDVLSVLFPAVPTPYRRLGWEMAGVVSRTTMPAEPLRALATSTVPVRRATGEDVDEVLRMVQLEGASARSSGPLELTAADVRELITDPDNFCYLASDGFLAYAWEGEELRVERLIAERPETVRALWALVGSGASVVQRVFTYLPAHDPIHWFLDGKAELAVQEDRWMLRLLDATAAIGGRGFPAGVSAEVPLTLEDPWMEGCAGSYRLRVESARGELRLAEPAPGAVVLGPNGLAALYAGTPMYTVRAAGHARGGNRDDDALLDAAFAARSYMIDRF